MTMLEHTQHPSILRSAAAIATRMAARRVSFTLLAITIAACARPATLAPIVSHNAGNENQPEASSLVPAAGPRNEDYSWLEHASDRARAWEREQDTNTSTFFASRQTVDPLLERIHAYHTQAPPAEQVDVRGDTIFRLVAIPGDDDRVRLSRQRGREASVTLFETTAKDVQEKLHVDFMSVSNLGRYVALAVSGGGRHVTTVRILDATTGKDLGDRSFDLRFDQLTWFSNDTAYLYTRGRGDAVPERDRWRDIGVAKHVLGTSPREDVELVGSQAAGDRLLSDYDFASPSTSLDGQHVALFIRHGTASDGRVFLRRETASSRDATPWKQVYVEADHVLSASAGRGRLLALRHSGLQTFVEEVSLTDVTKRSVLYTSTTPIENFFEIGQALYVVQLGSSGRQLLRVVAGKAEAVTGRDTSVSSSLGVDWLGHSAALQILSWSRPGAWFLVSQEGALRPLDQTKDSATRREDFDTWELDAPTRDGEQVHLLIVGPRGDRKPRYVWLRAYGSYGLSFGPNFDAARRVFLDMGGTYVSAQVRGGGEKGPPWHEAGRGANKIKTVEDFIDVAKFLRASGFGEGGGIFACGASAGGIPIGGLLVREPHLADGVAILSGVVNVARWDATSEVGPAQREEFGSAETAEGARRLRDIDVFENVRPGTAYPPVYLVTAVDDIRVPYWQSTKLAARLLRDSAANNPVLLRITGGDHMTGRSHREEDRLDAELVSFALFSVHR